MSCQVMYQSYYPYFNPYHHSTAHTAAETTTATTTTTAAAASATSAAAVTSPPASTSPGGASSATLTPAHILEPSPPSSSSGAAASLQLRSNSASPSPSSAHKSKRFAYGNEMQQHQNEHGYDVHQHISPHPQLDIVSQQHPERVGHHKQQQQPYLSQSPSSQLHVQQPLPATTMAPSVAALQRLSASIDVTAIPASRSNSRTSAYEDTTKDHNSDKEESVVVANSEATDRQPPQYLTANSVVYSFFSGDLTSAIEDHFNRALKRSSRHDVVEGNESPSHSDISTKQQSDSPVPMSQRNLPPSFWICDYYQQHSQHLQQQQQQQQHQQQYDPYDAYMQAADPWHNYMYHQHQRDVYSQASRQYSSLLHLQRSALQQQQGRQVAAALGKAPNDSWATAAAAGAAVEGFASASTHAHYPVTGLEGTMQGSSKDLYWF